MGTSPRYRRTSLRERSLFTERPRRGWCREWAGRPSRETSQGRSCRSRSHRPAQDLPARRCRCRDRRAAWRWRWESRPPRRKCLVSSGRPCEEQPWSRSRSGARSRRMASGRVALHRGDAAASMSRQRRHLTCLVGDVVEIGRCGAAPRHRHGAARMEATPGRGPRQIGGRAGDPGEGTARSGGWMGRRRAVPCCTGAGACRKHLVRLPSSAI